MHSHRPQQANHTHTHPPIHPLLRFCGTPRSWHFLSQDHPYFPDVLPLPLLGKLTCF